MQEIGAMMACGEAMISKDGGCLDWASTVLEKGRSSVKGRLTMNRESDEICRQAGKAGAGGIKGNEQRILARRS